jgi:hypothetical protein
MNGDTMPRSNRSILVVAGTAVALATGLAGSALAAPAEEASFGRHVAACAEMDLGQRPAAPSVTCAHHGTTMTSPTFGAMVVHMQDMHG